MDEQLEELQGWVTKLLMLTNNINKQHSMFIRCVNLMARHCDCKESVKDVHNFVTMLFNPVWMDHLNKFINETFSPDCLKKCIDIFKNLTPLEHPQVKLLRASLRWHLYVFFSRTTSELKELDGLQCFLPLIYEDTMDCGFSTYHSMKKTLDALPAFNKLLSTSLYDITIFIGYDLCAELNSRMNHRLSKFRGTFFSHECHVKLLEKTRSYMTQSHEKHECKYFIRQNRPMLHEYAVRFELSGMNTISAQVHLDWPNLNPTSCTSSSMYPDSPTPHLPTPQLPDSPDSPSNRPSETPSENSSTTSPSISPQEPIQVSVTTSSEPALASTSSETMEGVNDSILQTSDDSASFSSTTVSTLASSAAPYPLGPPYATASASWMTQPFHEASSEELLDVSSTPSSTPPPPLEGESPLPDTPPLTPPNEEGVIYSGLRDDL